MYEINTHNLKKYLIVLSAIFIFTNGKPLLNIFNKNTQNYINNYAETDTDNFSRNYATVKGEKFIVINNNYYNINSTVIKHSMIFNTKTNYFTGSVVLEYKNYNDEYQYCKIDFDIKEQRRNDVIYNFIYKYYNLSRNNINLYCNNNECIHKLYKYENKKYEDGKFEEIVCNILNIKQLNDEL
jgi:hypothetical protein